ncbi:MAG: MAPEG family protein, partial [Pseudanabaena sp.]
NATEYIPISLILLLLLELSKGHWSLLHIGGIVLLTGRLIHARGLLKGNLRFRVLGMQLTLFNIIYLAIANLIYFYFKS